MPLKDANNQVRPVTQHPSKRQAVAGPKRPQNKPAPKEDATYWKSMFDALQKERVTQAEAELRAYGEESETRENALKSYIQHLEGENRKHASKAQKQQREIELYQKMTGVSLANIAESSDGCDLVFTNSKTKQTTSLRISPSENDASMLKSEPLSNKELLPAFAQEPIEFEPAEAPSLTENVLRIMFPEE